MYNKDFLYKLCKALDVSAVVFISLSTLGSIMMLSSFISTSKDLAGTYFESLANASIGMVLASWLVSFILTLIILSFSMIIKQLEKLIDNKIVINQNTKVKNDSIELPEL